MFNKSLKFVLWSLFAFSLMTTVHAQSVESLFHNQNDPVAGNPKGKVTIVEFFDYQCSQCVVMAPVIDKIIKSNPDVRVVFKEYPIRGSMSEYAALAALAANKQGKYYQFSRALLTARQPLSQGLIFRVAKNVGMDVNKLKQEMNSNTIKKELNNNVMLAEKLRVSGTPAFFIGRTSAKTDNNVDFILGGMSPRELQDEVNKAM